MKKNLTILLIVIIASISVIVSLRSRGKQNIEPILKNVQVDQDAKILSKYTFEEMTIPYLKNRNYDSNLGDLEKIGENEDYTSYITFYRSDGLKIYGLLTVPKAGIPSGKFPVIIFLHGYIPPDEYRTTKNYVSYVDYLARSGYVVFKIDYRGNGDSEGEAGGAYYSGDYIIDTLNAYSALQKADFVGSGKIGLWGHSMAGNIVLRTLAAKPDIPSVVIWAGAGYTYADLRQYRINDSSYKPPPTDTERFKKREELLKEYGDFDPNNWFWKQVPATNYLSDIKGAIQLNHSENDNVVSVDYSKNLNSLLDKTTIDHELNIYPSGGHNLSGITFAKAMKNTAAFFDKHLKR